MSEDLHKESGIIYWFSRNHVAANFLMVVIVVLGVGTWPTIKKEIFPETSINSVNVSVAYPNATPDEVEKGIIIPIEEAIQDIEGIDRMKSVANQNIGVVTVEVANGFEVRNVMDDVKTRVDAIQNIAEEAEEPLLEELLIKAQVLSIAVSAETDEATLRAIAEKVRTGLLTYNGGSSSITQAVIAGARDYEISIEVSEETLRQYGISFDSVAMAVRKASLDLPGGSVRTRAGEVLLRTERRRYNQEDFRDIPVITRPDGSTVVLAEIAQIRDGFEEDRIDAQFDNTPAILINVFRIGNEDTIKIADTVKKFIDEEASSLVPEGVTLAIWKDDSVYLSGRLKLLAKNGIFGLLLVALVLTLFLRPSLALLVSIGIPVSFAGAITLMPYTGISINMISLFAFILVLGIVVDDAIVVGESVYSRMRKGEHPRLAAPRGTREVGIVVTFGVITTAMAFTPMLGLSGVSGKIWPNIPLIVIPTLIFSLFQSKLILPSHLALLKSASEQGEPGPILRFQHIFARGLEKFVDRFYRPVLKKALEFRYVVLAGFVALLIITVGTIASGWIKFVFFPEVETDVVNAKVKMAQGVSFERTEEVIRLIESKASVLEEELGGDPLIRHKLASVGTQPLLQGMEGSGGQPKGTNIGEVTLELVPSIERKYTGEDIVSKWRELVGPVPGTVELIFAAESASGGNAIDLEMVGDDFEQLRAATDEAKAALRAFTGLIDLSDSDIEGKRELKLDLLPSGKSLGLRLEDVARQVRQGFYGDEIQRLQRGKDEVKVFVRYPRDERTSLADLENMKIRLPDGSEVPFSEVASAEFGRSNATIQRTDQQRAIRITADVDKALGANATEIVRSLTAGARAENTGQLWRRNVINWFREKAGKPPLPEIEKGALVRIQEKYPGVRYSFEGEQKDQKQSMTEMGQKALLALLGMYVLMAIPLRSYVQPMIVMSVIPFGLVGAIVGHLLLGFNFSIMSMCGIVALAGVVVNDSLVLVDYVNRHVKAGLSIHEAAWEAGAARFRPIILTSLTTFAGLTPMLLETDVQARFLIPMAVSLSYGILFATLITLILIPCLYLMLEDFSNRFNLKWITRSHEKDHSGEE
ncbi:MAG: efflux RND transporter permease subunit [Verrucomicrobiales bacterium]|nr:efflux RND transporter permease subunit [Verrucomicrobiales bacterium]